MSVSGFSQISLKKTQFGNENGVLMNEVAMDSISRKLIRFNKCLSDNAQITLELMLAQKTNEKLVIENEFLKSDIAKSQLQHNELQKQLEIKEKLNQNDIMYWKQKAKGRFRAFLLGTGLGGLVVALLVNSTAGA